VDFGWESISIDILRGLSEGGVEACLFADAIFGDIMTKLDSKYNIGLSCDVQRYLSDGELKRAVGFCDDWTLTTEKKETNIKLVEYFA